MQKHHRRSIRLPEYDYASPGFYFVTVCVRQGECLLGDIVDGKMQLNPYGQVADGFWDHVPAHFSNDGGALLAVDAHVTMPNHIHAIIVIHDRTGAVTAPLPAPLPAPMDGPDVGAGSPGPGRDDPGRGNPAPTGGNPAPTGVNRAPTRSAIARPALGQIVGYYKYQTTKMMNQMRDMPGVPFWQRNYWEHVIRNDRSLQRIRAYIENNPARWVMDQLHPDAPPNPFNRGER